MAQTIDKKQAMETILKEWSDLIDPKIKEILNLGAEKEFSQLINYQINAGGKRLRPAICIAGFLIFSKKINDILPTAAGLEILHNCTLIYDDIIDNSRIRREKPTVWAHFGKSIAQCIGMDYSVAIFQAANQSKFPIETSKIFSRTMKAVVEGEILDILFEQSGRKGEKYIISHRYNQISEKDYLKMIGKKTASLIEACCEAGALTAGASQSQINYLKKYGYHLGIAFQITDDILDIFGEGKKFGKKIGKDIEERKLGNLVIFYALQELSLKQKKRFLNILRKSRIVNEDIRQAVQLIKKTGAKEKSLTLAKKHIQKAKNCLKKLPQNKWNNFLADLADFVVKREK